ncbi:MAG: metal ABC transporter permease [Lachnospiraceae bacterium]
MSTLLYYFSFPFVRNALIVGVLIALCAALFGVPLVLKRYSFIGDGLSHVAFGAMAIAGIMNLYSEMLVILPITVLTAVILLRTGQNSKLTGDAAIAMFSVSALAIGYLVMNIAGTSSNISGDVCSTLFGSTSLLTLTEKDVMVCAITTVIVISLFVLLYQKLFAVTFDEDFAKATGVNVSTYQLLIAIMTALIIVVAMKLVGTLLISALIIFPALSAMRLFRSFKSVMWAASIMAVVSATVGMIISILAATPTGATIVVTDLCLFLCCILLQKICRKG